MPIGIINVLKIIYIHKDQCKISLVPFHRLQNLIKGSAIERAGHWIMLRPVLHKLLICDITCNIQCFHRSAIFISAFYNKTCLHPPPCRCFVIR